MTRHSAGQYSPIYIPDTRVTVQDGTSTDWFSRDYVWRGRLARLPPDPANVMPVFWNKESFLACQDGRSPDYRQPAKYYERQFAPVKHPKAVLFNTSPLGSLAASYYTSLLIEGQQHLNDETSTINIVDLVGAALGPQLDEAGIFIGSLRYRYSAASIRTRWITYGFPWSGTNSAPNNYSVASWNLPATSCMVDPEDWVGGDVLLFTVPKDNQYTVGVTADYAREGSNTATRLHPAFPYSQGTDPSPGVPAPFVPDTPGEEGIFFGNETSQNAGVPVYVPSLIYSLGGSTFTIGSLGAFGSQSAGFTTSSATSNTIRGYMDSWLANDIAQANLAIPRFGRIRWEVYPTWDSGPLTIATTSTYGAGGTLTGPYPAGITTTTGDWTAVQSGMVQFYNYLRDTMLPKNYNIVIQSPYADAGKGGKAVKTGVGNSPQNGQLFTATQIQAFASDIVIPAIRDFYDL